MANTTITPPPSESANIVYGNTTVKDTLDTIISDIENINKPSEINDCNSITESGIFLNIIKSDTLNAPKAQYGLLLTINRKNAICMQFAVCNFQKSIYYRNKYYNSDAVTTSWTNWKILESSNTIFNTETEIPGNNTNTTVKNLDPYHTYRIDFLSWVSNNWYEQSLVVSTSNANTTTVIFNPVYSYIACRLLIMGANWNLCKIDGTECGKIKILRIVQLDQ